MPLLATALRSAVSASAPLAIAGLLLCALLCAPVSASAQAVAMTGRLVYHGYQIQLDPRGPAGDLRRLDQFYAAVEGGAYRLGPEGQFDLVASLRYDTDFGAGFSRDTPFGGGLTAVDDQNDVDLLFLYVDWRRALGDFGDLRFGRQLQIDDLDWYVLDGLKLMAHFWRDGENRFDAEIYAGVPVRFDTLFASSEALLGDGSEIYDGEDPFGGIAVGASAYLRILRDLSLSVSFRNELVFREGDIEGFGPAVFVGGPRIGQPIEGSEEIRDFSAEPSEETIGLQESLVGGSIGYVLRPLFVTLQGTLVYDALTDNLDRARALLGFDPASNVHLGLEYLRVRPRFVGDSIFNWFNIFPYERGRVEGSWSILDERLTFEASYFVQTFDGDPVLENEFAGEDITHGPGGGVSWRERWYGLSIYGEGATSFGGANAYGGNYANAWLTGDAAFFDGRLVADARVAVTTVQEDWVVGADEGQVDEPRTTYTFAVGVRGEITEWLRARALYVQNIDPILEGNYRVFTELAVVYR